MKKALVALQIADLLLLLTSLYFHSDALLIAAAAVMAVCIAATFATDNKKK